MSHIINPIQLHPAGAYKEYSVNSKFNWYIALYWIYENDTDTIFEAIPDGCIDLVISPILETCFIVPTPRKKQKYHIPANTPLFWIRFLPYMFQYFFKKMYFSKLDTMIEVNIDSHPLLHILCKETKKYIKHEEMIKKIEAILYKYIPLWYANKKQISQRQYQRNIIRTTGVTPKYFDRIMRLQKHLQIIKTSWGLKLFWWYYDQSHMIREFRALTGSTPKEFVKKIL